MAQQLDALVTVEEVSGLASKLKRRKAVGPDLVYNEFIRFSSRRFLEILAKFYSLLLYNGHYPTEWKIARVVMALKPGKTPDGLDSFRPISVTSNLGKLFERILLNRIVRTGVESIVIPNNQLAYRAGSSAALALQMFTTQVHQIINSRGYVVAVALDCSKAFDTVSHRILTNEINRVIPGKIAKVLESFISQRTFFVVKGTARSSTYSLKSGVPQGGIFSPFLFNLYLATLPRAREETRHIQFADDFLIYSMAEDPENATRLLQAHLDKVNDWCYDYGLRLNPEKSSSQFFYKNSKKPLSDLKLYLGTKAIPRDDRFSYLGVRLDRKLNYEHTITEIGKKVIKMGFALRKLFYRYPRTRWKIRGLLFKVCVRSLILYALPLLLSATRVQWVRVEAAETVALRAIFGRSDNYEGLLGRAEAQPIYQVYKELSNRFATKLVRPSHWELLEIFDLEEGAYPTSLFEAVRGLNPEFLDNLATIKSVAEFVSFERERQMREEGDP